MTPRHQRGPTAALRALFAAFAILLAQAAASAEELRGRVVGITDGDTLTLLTERREEVRIRLAAIDTPEGGQPYGTQACRSLSDLAFGKAVRVVVRDTDRYRRTVGRAYTGHQDIDAEMIPRGAAWVYHRYTLCLPRPDLPAPSPDSAGRARYPAASNRTLPGALVPGQRRAAFRRFGGAEGSVKA
jgi:endonuclease YncB( thermonuclease family)